MSSMPSILVVDDSTDGREMLVEYLAFRRFPVAEARSGIEAIDVSRRVQPNIILMDLSMPGMDGWEATRRLRADPGTGSTIIVAVTAHAFQREQEAARAAGCDVVIVKPFDLSALADALATVASDGLAAFGLKTATVTLRSQSATPAAGDASVAKGLSAASEVGVRGTGRSEESSP